MTGPAVAYLNGGARLHLQHGPIDLIIGADGDRQTAFDAAIARFGTVLDELVAELPDLRRPVSPETTFSGPVAQRMQQACAPLATGSFMTPMAAVAGSVADEVLTAMVAATPLRRAYVNNGGDIALHLARDAQFKLAMADHLGQGLGQIAVSGRDGIGGIATSGRHGRSFSLGIANSVTVLARTAAAADAAATLIANAVDLPGHPQITRQPAHQIDDTSDLGTRLVVTRCGSLTEDEADRALARGLATAKEFHCRGIIQGAALFLQGRTAQTGMPYMSIDQRTFEDA